MTSSCSVTAALLAILGLAAVPRAQPDKLAAARQAVEQAEREHGAEHPATARLLYREGMALYDAGQETLAAAAFERAIAIYERAGDQPALADCWNVLGNTVLQLANPARAKECHQRAIAILTAAAGADAQKLLSYRTNLAGDWIRLGELDAAAAELDDLQRQVEASRGPAHLDLATVLAKAALVDHQRYRLEPARLRLQRAADIYQRAAAAGNVKIKRAHASVLQNLGSILVDQMRYDEAIPILEQALRARRAEMEAAHPQILKVQCVLAMAYAGVGRAVDARHEYEACLAATADAQDLAWMRGLVLIQLVKDATEARELERAEHFAAQALALRDPLTELGRMARIELALAVARLRGQQGRHAEAVAQASEATTLADDLLGPGDLLTVSCRSQLATGLASQGKRAEAAALEGRNLDAIVGWLDVALPALLDAERRRIAARLRVSLDAYLTLGADDATAQARRLLAWKALATRGLLAARSRLRLAGDAATEERLARLQEVVAAATALRQQPGVEDQELRRLLTEKRDLEQQLAGAQPEPVLAPSPEPLANALAPGDALLDFVVLSKEQRLLAFVHRRGHACARVELGPLAPLVAALDAHRQVTARRTVAAADARLLEAPARALHVLLVEPLLVHVRDAGRWLICPDGPLALLPFATLPGKGHGSYLLEERDLRFLLAADDWLRPKPEPGEGLLAVGGVDYGPADPGASPLRSGARFGSLPGSAAEIDALAAALRDHEPVVLLRNAEASEARVREAAPGKRWLHLATHGFFAVGAAPQDATFASGIALAGANLPPAGSNDGILTAEEAAWLDLARCALVVVSACDSGLGVPEDGEPLLGLRRSLRLAGADATLTTLWKVDDEATRALMVDFYQRLARGAEPTAALRQAQLEMLARQRAQGTVLPGTWGAFVLEGR